MASDIAFCFAAMLFSNGSLSSIDGEPGRTAVRSAPGRRVRPARACGCCARLRPWRRPAPCSAVRRGSARRHHAPCRSRPCVGAFPRRRRRASGIRRRSGCRPPARDPGPSHPRGACPPAAAPRRATSDRRPRWRRARTRQLRPRCRRPAGRHWRSAWSRPSPVRGSGLSRRNSSSTCAAAFQSCKRISAAPASYCAPARIFEVGAACLMRRKWLAAVR